MAESLSDANVLLGVKKAAKAVDEAVGSLTEPLLAAQYLAAAQGNLVAILLAWKKPPQAKVPGGFIRYCSSEHKSIPEDEYLKRKARGDKGLW